MISVLVTLRREYSRTNPETYASGDDMYLLGNDRMSLMRYSVWSKQQLSSVSAGISCENSSIRRDELSAVFC